MKKGLLLIASLVASLVLLGTSLGNNSEASNYHKGTPKQLRGTSWHQTSNNSWSKYHFSKSSYLSTTMGMPAVKVTNVHYKVTSKGYYKLVGHGIKNGGYRGGPEVSYFKVSHGKLIVHYPKMGTTIYHK